MHIGIVGGGIAGSVAARALHRHNVRVTVLDKARGPGGRMSSRRSEVGRFDHGVAYFDAHAPEFRQWLAPLEAQGVVSQWSPRGIDGPVWVATPKMNRLVGAVQQGLEVSYGSRVSRIVFEDGGWTVTCESQDEDQRFDGLVLAIPSPQARVLMSQFPETYVVLDQIKYAPCWSAMIQYGEPLELSCAVYENLGPISRAVNESKKPGRAGDERWVLHMSAAWSQAHLELDPTEIAQTVCGLFQEAHGCSTPVSHATAHRWRFSTVTSVYSEPLLAVGDGTLAICGDGFGGAGISAAVCSAQEVSVWFQKRFQP